MTVSSWNISFPNFLHFPYGDRFSSEFFSDVNRLSSSSWSRSLDTAIFYLQWNRVWRVSHRCLIECGFVNIFLCMCIWFNNNYFFLSKPQAYICYNVDNDVTICVLSKHSIPNTCLKKQLLIICILNINRKLYDPKNDLTQHNQYYMLMWSTFKKIVSDT